MPKEYVPDFLNIGPVGVALWGVAAASLTGALSFGAAWVIIKGVGAAMKLYRKFAERSWPRDRPAFFLSLTKRPPCQATNWASAAQGGRIIAALK